MIMPLDPLIIRRSINRTTNKNLAALDVLAEVDSTNSYLLQKPVPLPGAMCIAVTDNQTAGRGRHGKHWQSPPGSGLCLSAAYTYKREPQNLSALTLAVGVAVISTLDAAGVKGVQLKWPNDLIADQRKLGGILTELRRPADRSVTVVTGIGINVELPESFVQSLTNERVTGVVDLSSICATPPVVEVLAGILVNNLFETFSEFGTNGFAPMQENWRKRDWLFGRNITVRTQAKEISGVAAGIDSDGALLLDRDEGGQCRVVGGSIVTAGIAPEAGNESD